MLVYFLLGVMTTLAYALRGSILRLRSVIGLAGTKELQALHQRYTPLVVYSENANYWALFQPLVCELSIRGIPCTYYTSDKTDPALDAQYTGIEVVYIGTGMRAWSFLNKLQAGIVVMTMPQLDVMWIKRSPKVQHYVHMIHAPTDALLYRKFAFDYFDSVMCSGQHQIDSIRALEQVRNLPPKKLFATGLLYYDQPKAPARRTHSTQTLLIAPTWGRSSLFTRFGLTFINQLLASGVKLIIRPHPQSFQSEPDIIAKLQSLTCNLPNCLLDTAPYADDAMAQSDLLISDISGVLFDFAFRHTKPIIVMGIDKLSTASFEAEDVAERPIWEVEQIPHIAYSVEADQIDRLSHHIHQAIANYDSQYITQLRDKALFHYGEAAPIAVSQLIALQDKSYA